MTPKIREIVYAKYGGRCAYCGVPIEMKDMQVDHIVPANRGGYNIPTGNDEIDNLNPSCRACNYYKSMYDIEGFRNRLKNDLDYKHTFATKMALRYGILKEQEWDGKFYFERQKEKKYDYC